MAPARLTVRRFQAEDLDAIEALNARLAKGGISDRVFPERPGDSDETGRVRDRLFVATDGSEIRGGIWLREQEVWIGGQAIRAGWAKYPVAESLVNGQFAGVPAALVLQLLREQPHLMALGLGGHGLPFAKLLSALRWTGSTVPFYFRVARPARVLRRLTPMRTSRVRRLAMDAGAYSGLGWLLNTGFLAARSVVARRPPRCSAVTSETFDSWADHQWTRSRARYGFVASRSAETLNRIYAKAAVGLTRLRVSSGGRELGWVSTIRMTPDRPKVARHFGDLTIGLLADALSDPADALAVTAAGVDYLLDAGVDLLVTNQHHPAWADALEALGFLRGPSNFAFYRSPATEKLLAGPSVRASGYHLTRGDCDGPVWS